ncbi:uncharacterized protein TEOVI_000085300 [Trypanosoma equiperdum]|uniref:Uncharacterized protein n=1 Tax=Trypanosoma equiperdum TaxID=5694 RepID=A0A1G4IAK2_TRYEQ|nr:hypothetical protein TEOVI_000085300 [Trypanosoma equiperdum]
MFNLRELPDDCVVAGPRGDMFFWHSAVAGFAEFEGIHCCVRTGMCGVDDILRRGSSPPVLPLPIGRRFGALDGLSAGANRLLATSRVVRELPRREELARRASWGVILPSISFFTTEETWLYLGEGAE